MEVSIGYASIAAGNEICGDTAVSCYLPDGGRAVILSDGMGRGCAAAAESRAVVRRLRRLLKEGMPAGRAIQTVNRQMEQEENEIFATLDLLILNPQCSQAVFYKQAAAPSYLIRREKLLKIQQPALPVGIVPAVGLAQIRTNLKPGDMLIMTSDGIPDSGKPIWLSRYLQSQIYDMIENNSTWGPRQLARRILEESIRQRSTPGPRPKKIYRNRKPKADDATVVVLQLH